MHFNLLPYFNAIFYDHARYPLFIFILACIFAYEGASVKRTVNRIGDIVVRLVNLWHNIDFLRFVVMFFILSWWYHDSCLISFEYRTIEITQIPLLDFSLIMEKFNTSSFRWPEMTCVADCPNVFWLLKVSIAMNVILVIWIRSFVGGAYSAQHNKMTDQIRQFNAAGAFARMQQKREK
jgi:hypothetical protein